MRVWLVGLVIASVFCCAPRSYAWGPEGHHTVALIAADLIQNTAAEKQVKAILGDISLVAAAVWADCAKAVDPTTFVYQNAGRYPECSLFETPEREAAMVDFVRRNTGNCIVKPGEEICHKQYHYADVAYQRGKYEFGGVGTRNDDIVHAIVAASQVLKGKRSPAPFSIRDKKEALLLLAHYVGDIHQPLHVGAVYLTPGGTLTDPDKGSFDPLSDTKGGNLIDVEPGTGNREYGSRHSRHHHSAKAQNLHFTWDGIPGWARPNHVTEGWLAQAREVPPDTNSADYWPTVWASESVEASRQAFSGLTFGPLESGHWSVVLPSGYARMMADIKRRQLTLAGAHLAELLQEIFR